MKKKDSHPKPKKSKGYKVFLYTDQDFSFGPDNVFISGPYRHATAFKTLNPGMKPILSYDALELISFLKKQMPKKVKNEKESSSIRARRRT